MIGTEIPMPYNIILLPLEKFVKIADIFSCNGKICALECLQKLKRWGMDEQEIRMALCKRAVGFECDEIVEEYITDEQGNSVLSKRKNTKKFNPPDVTALRFLLEQISLSDDDLSKMTDEQLLKEKKRLLSLLKEEEEKKNENANLQA